MCVKEGEPAWDGFGEADISVAKLRARAASRREEGEGGASWMLCGHVCSPRAPRVSGDQSGRHRQGTRCHPATLLQPWDPPSCPRLGRTAPSSGWALCFPVSISLAATGIHSSHVFTLTVQRAPPTYAPRLSPVRPAPASSSVRLRRGRRPGTRGPIWGEARGLTACFPRSQCPTDS